MVISRIPGHPAWPDLAGRPGRAGRSPSLAQPSPAAARRGPPGPAWPSPAAACPSRGFGSEKPQGAKMSKERLRRPRSPYHTRERDAATLWDRGWIIYTYPGSVQTTKFHKWTSRGPLDPPASWELRPPNLSLNLGSLRSPLSAQASFKGSTQASFKGSTQAAY